MNAEKINYYCADCGQAKLTFEGWAAWDFATQDWTHSSTNDEGQVWCDECEDHVEFVDRSPSEDEAMETQMVQDELYEEAMHAVMGRFGGALDVDTYEAVHDLATTGMIPLVYARGLTDPDVLAELVLVWLVPVAEKLWGVVCLDEDEENDVENDDE